MNDMNKITFAVAGLLIGIAGTFLVITQYKPDTTEKVTAVARTGAISAENPYENIPAIDAYYEGKKLWFIHTDVSDEGMAERLTKMVRYNTVHSPRLGKVDSENLGTLYVFVNGIDKKDTKPWGGGPFGFQLDVFDSIPGDPKYSPVRYPQMVKWRESATPRILTSVAEIKKAESEGEILIMKPGVVVNVPVVKWPGEFLGGQSKIE